jgi:hypothetical protein
MTESSGRFPLTLAADVRRLTFSCFTLFRKHPIFSSRIFQQPVLLIPSFQLHSAPGGVQTDTETGPVFTLRVKHASYHFHFSFSLQAMQAGVIKSCPISAGMNIARSVLSA